MKIKKLTIPLLLMAFAIVSVCSGSQPEKCGKCHSDSPAFKEWHTVELYFKLSNPGGETNGVASFRLDSDFDESTGIVTRKSGDSSLLEYFMFGQSVAKPAYASESYIDDVYVDNTRARVEIGDNAIFANCTHREIQIPSDWSDNGNPGEASITITLNRGSFDPCETYYLFIIDANGNINSTGYPIRFGTGAGEPPCPPIKRDSDGSIIQ